jgi:HPt (histidine-containing phosphotransfer) domain-containing protein
MQDVHLHDAPQPGKHSPAGAAAAASVPPPDAAASEERINRAVLDEFRELMGDEGQQMVSGLVSLYLKDAPLLIEDMRQSAGCADLDGLRRAAHTLKGNSSQVGASRLSSLCFDLEQAAKAGSLEGAGPMIGLIQAEFVCVKDSLFLM